MFLLLYTVDTCGISRWGTFVETAALMNQEAFHSQTFAFN